jgi:hypothetical protein
LSVMAADEGWTLIDVAARMNGPESSLWSGCAH